MDDATQKLGTCPTCRHAEHEGHICLNMASDYDCGCDKRPAKVADDATQKLVDEARLTLPGDARMEAYYFGFERTGVAAVDAILSAVAVAGKGSHHTEGWSDESEHGYYSDRAGLPANPGGSAVSLIQAAASEAAGLVRSLAAALEAAQRPPVAEPDNHHNADVCPFCTRNRDEREAAIRAEAIAQRPPVSPEVREEVAEMLMSIYDHGAHPNALREADALLARFSFPSQPVYDEEKIARWLYLLAPAIQQWEGVVFGFDAPEAASWREAAIRNAAALVAALRGGELTREESDRG